MSSCNAAWPPLCRAPRLSALYEMLTLLNSHPQSEPSIGLTIGKCEWPIAAQLMGLGLWDLLRISVAVVADKIRMEGLLCNSSCVSVKLKNFTMLQKDSFVPFHFPFNWLFCIVAADSYPTCLVQPLRSPFLS
jgi:hypothetical protein